MIEANSFQQIINRGFIKQICDKILQGIEKVQNAPDYERRRWIWELMQNAKDVPNCFGSVSIKLELYPDRLVFSHNGDPFTKEHLSSLIMQVSSKDDAPEDSETTGKFGTGFITSHMLSRKIQVKGVLEVGLNRYKKFSVLLDRSGENYLEMRESIEVALEKLKELENGLEEFVYERTEDRYDTIFEYPLASSGLDIAKEGIEDLAIALPYTMTFVPKIKSVSVEDHIGGVAYTISQMQEIIVSESESGQPFILRTFSKENTRRPLDSEIPPHERVQILSLQSGDVTMAQSIIQHIDNTLSVKRNGEELPKIFRDFPLVGTGGFNFPVVLNSHLFRPTEPRDGIYLKNPENVNVLKNREILTNSLSGLQAFIKFFIEQRGNDAHLLALSSLPENRRDYIDLNWYEVAIQRPLRFFLLDQQLVTSENGSKVTLRSVRVPVYTQGGEKRRVFFELIKELYPNEIPSSKTFADWLDIVLPQYETWNAKLKYSLGDLLTEIQGITKLSNLEERFRLNEKRPIDWLNQLVDFLIVENGKGQLDTFAILPNQKGRFKSLSLLKYDDGIPIELLDVLDYLQEDWRDQLIHKDVTRIVNHPSLGVKDISGKINELIQAFTRGHKAPDANQTKGLMMLLGYFTSEGSKRRKLIWDFARKLFPNQVAETYKVVPETSVFSWDSINRWTIQRILTAISGFGSVASLTSIFDGNEEDALFFLNQVLTFVANDADYSSYLDQYLVVPCQYGDFRYLKNIDNDPDKIPEELKLTLYNLTSGHQDWKADLLHYNIEIKTTRQRSLRDICSQIDDLLIEKRNEGSLATTHKNSALQIINLIKSNEQKYRGSFPNLSNSFAQIQVELMEEHQESINRILQHEGKISALAAIAESTMTSDQISNLINVTEELGVRKIMDAAHQLLEEKRDFEFKRKIGLFAEDSFRQAAQGNSLLLEVITRDGTQDFVFKHPVTGEEYLVEIKSIAQSSNHVLMSKRQGQTASQRPNKYALCVIQRPFGELAPSQSYFLSQAKFVINIGQLISEQVQTGIHIDQSIDAGGNIEIAFVNREYKFKVNSSVWHEGLNYNDFLSWLAKHFRSQ